MTSMKIARCLIACLCLGACSRAPSRPSGAPADAPTVVRKDQPIIDSTRFHYRYSVRYRWPHAPQAGSPYHVITHLACRLRATASDGKPVSSEIDWKELWQLDDTGEMTAPFNQLVRDYAGLTAVEECCSYEVRGVEVTSGAAPIVATLARDHHSGYYQEHVFQVDAPRTAPDFAYDEIPSAITRWTSNYRRAEDPAHAKAFGSRLAISGVTYPFDLGDPFVPLADCKR